MLFAGLIWLTAAAVAISFAIKRWWFPPPINAYAANFDSYFSLNIVAAGIIFLLAQAALGWFIWRFRNQGRRVRYTEGSNRLEVVWTVVTLALFVGASVPSAVLWSRVHLELLSPTTMTVELQGQQFAWNVRYPGPDGRYGKTNVRFVNDASGNPFGIDDRDPAGKDDVVSSALRIPAGKPVLLRLHSRDVIHSFFVRELRIKQDLVPGMEIPLKIEADKPGEYEIACSELCGLGHHQMRSVLIVLPPDQFDAWLRQQETRK
jgi:cytochrome c oxidase subunit 2